MILLFIPFLAAWFLVYSAPFAADTDIFLHLKVGEWVATHHRPLMTEIFTYTAAGSADESWHSWLSQWLFFKVYNAFGIQGLKWLSLIVLWALLGIAGRFIYEKTRSHPITLIGMTIVLLIHQHCHVLRPLLLGELLFGVATLTSLSSSFLGAFLLSVLWANVHASAVLAPLLMASPGAFIASFCGTLLNPKGWGLYQYAWDLSRLGKQIDNIEWNGLKLADFQSTFAHPYEFSFRLDIAAIVLGAGILFLLWKKREFRLALCLALPLLSVRHTLFLIYPAAQLTSAIPSMKRNHALLLSLCLLFGFRFYRSYDVNPSIEKVSHFIQETGLKGNLFCEPVLANEFIFRNGPDIKVAYDMRTMVHADFFRRAKLLYDRFGMQAWNLIIKEVPSQTQLLVASAGFRHPDWRVIYENNSHALAIRPTADMSKVVEYYQKRKIAYNPHRGFETAEIVKNYPQWISEEFNRKPWGKFPEPAAVGYWLTQQKKFYEANHLYTFH